MGSSKKSEFRECRRNDASRVSFSKFRWLSPYRESHPPLLSCKSTFHSLVLGNFIRYGFYLLFIVPVLNEIWRLHLWICHCLWSKSSWVIHVRNICWLPLLINVFIFIRCFSANQMGTYLNFKLEGLWSGKNCSAKKTRSPCEMRCKGDNWICCAYIWTEGRPLLEESHFLVAVCIKSKAFLAKMFTPTLYVYHMQSLIN